jgi:hypothetical protein
MSIPTLTRAYDNHDDADAARSELLGAGVAEQDIGLISRAEDGSLAAEPDAHAVATGASIGTLIGGGLGTVAGLGVMAIPGVGPIVAAGWVVALLTGAGVGAATGAGVGAAASGLFETLHNSGLSEEEAGHYVESVRRGGSLLLVRVADPALRARAETLLSQSGHVDLGLRSQEWRDAGWKGFDRNATSIDTRAQLGS